MKTSEMVRDGKIVQDGIPYVRVVPNQARTPGRCHWSVSSYCSMREFLTVESYTPKIGLLPRARIDTNVFCRDCFLAHIDHILALSGLQKRYFTG